MMGRPVCAARYRVAEEGDFCELVTALTTAAVARSCFCFCSIVFLKNLSFWTKKLSDLLTCWQKFFKNVFWAADWAGVSSHSVAIPRCEKWPFYISDGGRLSRAFALILKASSNYTGVLNRCHISLATTASTKITHKLLVCFSTTSVW